MSAAGAVGDAIEWLMADIAPEVAATVFADPSDRPSIRQSGITLADYLRGKQPGAFEHVSDQNLEACALSVEVVRRARARGACLDPAFVDAVYAQVDRLLAAEHPSENH